MGKRAAVTVGFALGYASGMVVLAVSAGALPSWTVIPATILITLIGIWAIDR